MKHSGLLIIVLCLLFFHVKAQETSDSDSGVLHPLQPSLAVIMGILSVMVSVTFLLLAYAKFCKTNPLDVLNQGTDHENFHALIPATSRLSGIDRTLIESLPFFSFSSLKGSKEGLECSVCISKFEDSELLRLLPKCRHAFHMNCIDQWLLSHSSCPLCRCKFDPGDTENFTYTNSSRFLHSPSNLNKDPNLELFVQREHDSQGSSRFSIGSSFRNNNEGEKEESLVQEGGGDRRLLHKFKHKIIVSDVIIKNRWSDVNSVDLMFLTSEMLSVLSSRRFSSLKNNSRSSQNGMPTNEKMMKVKEDLQRKRVYESKLSGTDTNNSVSASSIASTSFNETNPSKALSPGEKRSVSEITNIPRFKDFSTNNKIDEAATGGRTSKEERIRRIWLPIAWRTVERFAGQERNFQESENKKHNLEV